ncbi:MAG: YceI family protein [Flavobacteriales bacterium]
MKIVHLITVLFLSLTSFGQGWKILETQKVAFSNKDVSGTFDDISGTIVFDPANLTGAKFNLKLKVESINTGNGLQNKHARGDEWFNADKYPYIEFESTKIEKTETGFKAIGKLEMHGVKKDMVIPFTFSKKGTKATFIAKFNVNRTDFNIGKKGDEVADNIKITATLPVQKK